MADFHFIRPLWLLALIALVLTLYLLKKYRISQSGWQQLLPSHLAKVLIDGKANQQPLSLTMPFLIGLFSIIAMAGPSWQKLPQPVYQLERGSVLIMDMSYSMLSTDLSPNRLTRARYKATDLLDNLNEGEIGLIAYAGDAFVISPLTDDINNIKLLLPSLSPEIMPELGSNPYPALTMAHDMLTNAGHVEGDIYWFTDGIDNEDLQDITNWSRKHPHRLNILGIGTKAGAPIKLSNGELMKDNSGAIIVPKLPQKRLRGVASRGRGKYHTITNDFVDINELTTAPISQTNDKKEQSLTTGDQWQEAGPYLLLLVLPLVLGYFRRGIVVVLLPLCVVLTPPPSHASLWQDLWKTKDQQAQQKFDQQAYDEAANQFENPLWQGSSHYRAGNFEQALKSFQQSDTAQAAYNQGNALAKLQKLDEAIKAYDDALAKDPSHQDAKANKAILEKLKQQREQNQQNSSDQQQDNQEQNQDKSDDQQQNDQNQQGQDQQSQQQSQDQQQGEQGQDSQQQGEKESEQSKNNSSESNERSEENSQQDAQQEPDNKTDEQQQESTKEQQAADEDAEPQNQKPLSQQAKLEQDKLDQETEQMHQQLLNKVTDDPYLLLRNKMQIEYQKRRHNQSSIGVKKKW